MPLSSGPLRGVRSLLPASTGGLRFATTTGYFLATLRVASLDFKLESTKRRIVMTRLGRSADLIGSDRRFLGFRSASPRLYAIAALRELRTKTITTPPVNITVEWDTHMLTALAQPDAV